MKIEFTESQNKIMEEDDVIEEIKDQKVTEKEYNEITKKLEKFQEEEKDIENKIVDLESELIDKLTQDFFKANNDIIFDLFSKVIGYEKEQIIRYSRELTIPLWYNQNNIIEISKLKCIKCNSNLNCEFQIMPYIFSLYEEILNIDIGTILGLTCSKSCNSDYEEFYIQRTGENLIGNDGKTIIKDKTINMNMNLNKNKKKKEELIDEEGFTIVQKKKKK